MSVATIFHNSGSQQSSVFPAERQCHGDWMQDLISMLGVYHQSMPSPWLPDHDTTQNSTQAASEISVYSNRTESAHPIKTDAECYNNVQVKTETCSCDVCNRLYVGACNLLQFEENIRVGTSVAMERENNQGEKTIISDTTALRSDEYLPESKCRVCGEDLEEDNTIPKEFKELSLSSNVADKHSSDKLCLTCLMNNEVTSIYNKIDMLDDVTNGIEYECSVCVAVFQSRTKARKHMDTHDRVHNHVCPFCQKLFSDGKEFYSHFLTHEKGQTFTCRLCQKVFISENKYKSHVKSHAMADTLNIHYDDAVTHEIDQSKSANGSMYGATSYKHTHVINDDVSAMLPLGGDGSKGVFYKDLVESGEATPKLDRVSNVQSDHLPAFFDNVGANASVLNNKREQGTHLNSPRDLIIKENCSKQDSLPSSIGSVGGIACLDDDRSEIVNVWKDRVEKGCIEMEREKPEQGDHEHIDAASGEEGNNDSMKTSRDGKKVTESGQVMDRKDPEDQNSVDGALSEVSNAKNNEESNIQINHISGSSCVRQRDLSFNDQKQSTLNSQDIDDLDKTLGDLPEDVFVLESRSKEFNVQVAAENDLEEVCDLSRKKYNIDKSKKLHIRKTLVIPKKQLVPLTKRQTDGNNNELLIKQHHSKFTQQVKTTKVQTKKLTNDKNNNPTFEKHEQRHNADGTAKPSVKVPSFCSKRDINGNKILVSNFLLAEESLNSIPQNKKQSSRKRHSSKRKRLKTTDRNLKNVKRHESSDTKHSNLTTTSKRRKCGSSAEDDQSEWTSSEEEVMSSDKGSTDELTLSTDCSDGESGDRKDVSGDSDSPSKRFKCKYCLKTFRSRCYLSSHMWMHEGNGRFQCDICSKNCTSGGDLAKHMTVHTGDRPFQCDVCHKSFSQKVNLKRHMTTHLGKDRETSIPKKNLFRCDFCDKGFTQKCHMDRHRRLHTGEKPFSCHICSEKFLVKHHLKRHLMKHENGKIMKCTVCEKKYTRRLEYSQHLRTHEEFKDYRLYTCDVCERGYDSRQHLVQHMLIHTGEKPFNCAVCNKSFSCKNTFRGHNKGMKHKRRLMMFEKRQLKNQSEEGNLVS